MRPYARLVSVQKIFAILVALSVLFAPGVAGAAMVSSHNGMQMAEAGHCQAPPSSSDDHGKMAGKSCCIAMCIAVAIAPSAPFNLPMPRQQESGSPTTLVYNGILREIATPPPRTS